MEPVTVPTAAADLNLASKEGINLAQNSSGSFSSRDPSRIEAATPGGNPNDSFDPNDPAFRGLTPYEKKSLLINRELDAMGMGRYQWSIWGLCGLGYFLDLLWAQAFGLIATPLMQELGFSSKFDIRRGGCGDGEGADKTTADQLGNIFSAFSAGLCAGAFTWGVLVDIIGKALFPVPQG
jgi:hypothetical protein